MNIFSGTVLENISSWYMEISTAYETTTEGLIANLLSVIGIPRFACECFIKPLLNKLAKKITTDVATYKSKKELKTAIIGSLKKTGWIEDKPKVSVHWREFLLNLKEISLFVLAFICYFCISPMDFASTLHIDMSTNIGQLFLNNASLVGMVLALVGLVITIINFIKIKFRPANDILTNFIIPPP